VFTGKQLAAFCEKVYAAKWVYWYGTCGYKCTDSLYKSKKKQYPAHYTESRERGYKKDIAAGKFCADCVGMIKAFFWCDNVFEGQTHYASNHCPDKSANGMFKLCTKTGAINTIPDIPGLVVWKDGHIGVYVGDGMVVEMRGFDYDCMRREVKAGSWSKWGQLPATMILYTDDEVPETPEEPVGERELYNGCEGADVKQLQEDLISLGYSCGKWGADGEFGDCTEQAVEAFQRDHGLPVTGVYDAATREAMEKALDEPDVDEPKYVKIVGGNCYVRTAPNTNGNKLGVAHEGDVLPYGGQTSDNGWHLVDYKNENGWVSGKYSKLVDGAGITRGEKILDMSKYQDVSDYNALISDTALIILRAGYRSKDGNVYLDQKFVQHANELRSRNIRFGVYFFSIATNEDMAAEEAQMFWNFAHEYNPYFWAIDAERDAITNAAITAFAEAMRKLGVKKVGAYIANQLYEKFDYDSIRDKFDFTWIPKYTVIAPKYKCDLWQYTCDGQVNGIKGNVDLNKITGEGRNLEWFTE
jgi:GH25 family lysozyme M1 (1,4-beta-N-acetylmuramidase)